MENGESVLRNCIIILCLSLVVLLVTLWRAPADDDELYSRERVEAGTVKAISTTDSLLGDTTTLIMNNGKVIALDGRINPWQAGDPVTQPIRQPGDSDQTVKKISEIWCVKDKCLQLK